MLLGTILVAGGMAVVLIIWKKRVGRTARNLAHMVAGLFTLHLPGPEVSLDNPESLKIPFGVAVAVTVVLYTVGQAWGAFSDEKWEILEENRQAKLGEPEIAEAAIVLPLMFTMLLGIYWFGRAYNVYSTITHAAREGPGRHCPILRDLRQHRVGGEPGCRPRSTGLAGVET